MSKRALILITLSLAVLVFLVCVLPQVDLDDGVLRDVQWQVQMLVFALLAVASVIPIALDLLRRQWENVSATAPPGALATLNTSILRC